MSNYEKERTEAIDAGNRALNSLYAAKEELSKASGWGLFDIIGGGFISGLIKRGKMENANRYLREAKYDLDDFLRELADININLSLEIQTDDFLTITDIFFDNIFSDLLVQKRIKETLEAVETTIDRVEMIMNRII